MIRIIGGEHRRRQLKVLDRPGLRPTPDRVRETLFNWLAGDLHGARVLDLFAGSGALGLEALSRGAAHCTFVEKDAAAARLLRENLQHLRLSERARVLHSDALTFCRQTPAQPYDGVFLDPPYASALLDQTLPILHQPGWLADEAWLFIEHSVQHTLDAELTAGWEKHRAGTAGEVSYNLYRTYPAD